MDDATFDAWQDVPGPEDELVEDTTEVDLTKPDTEKFLHDQEDNHRGLRE